MNIIKNFAKTKRFITNTKSIKISWIGTAFLLYHHDTTDELQRIPKQHGVQTFYKTTNTIRGALIKIKNKIPFTSTQNSVYRLGCVNCDAFYAGESSGEIKTHAKKHESYTKRPYNPVELEKLNQK
ncbi:hypothetical protein EWB00_007164 [Schistosoma japonicum]|uniref:C2H2-type domain-containing protein n=1 Tax=Schistosoma japonicum TaxID=6182 RepID=A0A4Z2CVI4_SCHJA|nr:hypothetical protein EWB00_007164 [Schistosoma japonicum]